MIDAQLSKDQVLELYLNRIYLSAGVYGVETMSRHLFGRPAKQLTLAESALIAGLARAPAALSPWNHLDDAVARSHVVLGADARRRIHHGGAGAGGAARASSRSALSRRRNRAGRLREGLPASAVPRSVRRRPSARLGSPDDVRAGPAGDGGARGIARGCAASAIPSCRRRWSRSIRGPATSWRWWAAAISASRSSTARAAAAGSRDRRSSRCSTPRRSSTDSRRCRCCRTSDTYRLKVPTSGRRATPRRTRPIKLTLRAALLESDNRAATLLQQRVGSRAGAQARLRRRPARHAGRAVAVARDRASSRRWI